MNSTRHIPVSYTHLRAHETRHDLVCRLLLEKKKQLSLLSVSTCFIATTNACVIAITTYGIQNKHAEAKQ